MKDLPIFINGFAVGMLLWMQETVGLFDISMYVLAMVTFLWYGEIQRNK
jgi:hypothetical protein